MLNIAVDGHAGSGKSVLSRLLAKKLGVKVLNTGSIYRALACEYRERNLGEPNENKIDEFIKNINVDIKFQGEEQIVLVNNKDYTSQLREEEISSLASKISPFIKLRKIVLNFQREFAKVNDCVMEGRDIGSEVLQDAQFKFFITASKEVRAKRRCSQLENANYRNVLKDIMERDYLDEHRKVAPLKPSQTSIIIDNSFLSIDETLEKMLNYIKLGLEK